MVMASISIVRLTPALAQSGNTMAVMQLGTDYHLTVSTDPQTVVAEQPFTLTLQIFKPDGTTPVQQFDVEHTKLLHLILVSDDLTQFLHVHPDYQGNGVFVLKDAVVPVPADYVVFADFVPTGDEHQVARATLATQDAKAGTAQLAVTPRETTSGPLKISLDAPDNLIANTDTSLTFHFHDAQSGAPIQNLDEYLGAGGHLVIVDQTTQIYIHTHPNGEDMSDMGGMAMGTATPDMSSMNMATATPDNSMGGMAMGVTPTAAVYGPDLTFMTAFPKPGFYKLWVQVQYKGTVYVAPFVVNVSGGESTAEATMDMNGMGGMNMLMATATP